MHLLVMCGVVCLVVARVLCATLVVVSCVARVLRVPTDHVAWTHAEEMPHSSHLAGGKGGKGRWTGVFSSPDCSLFASEQCNVVVRFQVADSRNAVRTQTFPGIILSEHVSLPYSHGTSLVDGPFDQL